MPRRTLLTLVVLLALSTAACGDRSLGDRATESAPEPGTPSATTPPEATPSATTPSATTPPSEALQKIRVVGQVIEVGDCVVVRDDNEIAWTISGDLAADLVLGGRVQVTGAPDLVAPGCGGSVVTAARVVVLG